MGLCSVLPVPYCHPLEMERGLTPHCVLTGAEPGLGAEQGPFAPSSGVGDVGESPRPVSPAPEHTQCPTGGRDLCTASQHLLSGPLVGWRGSRAAEGQGGDPSGRPWGRGSQALHLPSPGDLSRRATASQGRFPAAVPPAQPLTASPLQPCPTDPRGARGVLRGFLFLFFSLFFNFLFSLVCMFP